MEGEEGFIPEGLILNLDEAWNINYEDLEIEEEIGRGSFGCVYKGTYFGTEVAIKKISCNLDEDPDALLYLEREVNVMKGMRHPNIVTFIGICQLASGGLLLITEFVKHGDLRGFLKDTTLDMSWYLRVKIAYDIACAMAYLHSRSVIHRDLKSKNLLVDDNWKVKVCDFGFARTMTNRPMTLCGTDEWMAPEMILGQQYTNKVDVFSYGIVLCEIMTRKKISTELQRSALEAFSLDTKKLEALIPPDCPKELYQLVLDCCQYEPESRPAFNEIVKRTRAILKRLPADGSVSATPSTAPPAAGTRTSLPPTRTPPVAAPVASARPTATSPSPPPRENRNSLTPTPGGGAPAPAVAAKPAPPARPLSGVGVPSSGASPAAGRSPAAARPPPGGGAAETPAAPWQVKLKQSGAKLW
ncbi:LISK family protein kinase [Balamuthia mandrillaris]